MFENEMKTKKPPHIYLNIPYMIFVNNVREENNIFYKTRTYHCLRKLNKEHVSSAHCIYLPLYSHSKEFLYVYLLKAI